MSGSSRGLRVLQVIDSLAPAGAEQSLVAMAPHIVDQGIDLHVAALSGPDDLAAPLRAAGISVRLLDVPKGHRRAAISALRALMVELRPDLLHTTLFESDFAGRISARMTRTPVVVSLVNMQYSAAAYSRATRPWRLRAYQTIDRGLARYATRAFHAISRAVADDAVQTLGIDQERVEVIPRGRDRASLGWPSDERRDRVRAALGIAQDATVLINVARHEPQKALDQLLRAVSLMKTDQDVVLLQVGRRGNASETVAALIDDLALRANVRLLGKRDDVPDLLAAADVFVSSALWEGFGGAVLEAMAMGVPVVGYALPPLVEVTGGTARLVEPGDVTALGASLEIVLANRSAAADRAAEGMRRFEERFRIEPVAAHMASFYRSAVTGAETDFRA